MAAGDQDGAGQRMLSPGTGCRLLSRLPARLGTKPWSPAACVGWGTPGPASRSGNAGAGMSAGVRNEGAGEGPGTQRDGAGGSEDRHGWGNGAGGEKKHRSGLQPLQKSPVMRDSRLETRHVSPSTTSTTWAGLCPFHQPQQNPARGGYRWPKDGKR